MGTKSNFEKKVRAADMGKKKGSIIIQVIILLLVPQSNEKKNTIS